MGTRIVRTATRAEGGITAAERAAMAEHVELWTKRAFRTAPIDPAKIIPAIEGLYASAGLAKPRVVIAPSPYAMAFAYGAAATLWDQHPCTRRATDAAIRDATDTATFAATFAATRDATRAATRAATDTATDVATFAATRDATRAATDAATDAATFAATFAATRDAIRDATDTATSAATSAAATSVATNDATRDATTAATRDATFVATDAATGDATRDATFVATDAATGDATYAATYAATNDATRSATRAATRAATRDAEADAAAACWNLAGEEGLQRAAKWYDAYQGGNMWASFDCYLTAARDILGLRLPEHNAYAHWEQAAIHGGFRVMHPKFCIVSDFPEHLSVDDQNRPHNENGPSHQWRDGWRLYHWHGVKVPEHWIEDKANLDPAEVLRARNVEQRAAGAAIIGWARLSNHLKRRVIDGDPATDIGALVELTLPGLPQPGRFLMAMCPRNGQICEGVPRVSDIDNLPINTVIAAQAWRDGLPAAEYQHPLYRT